VLLSELDQVLSLVPRAVLRQVSFRAVLLALPLVQLLNLALALPRVVLLALNLPHHLALYRMREGERRQWTRKRPFG
jgi:hypothetical protein